MFAYAVRESQSATDYVLIFVVTVPSTQSAKTLKQTTHSIGSTAFKQKMSAYAVRESQSVADYVLIFVVTYVPSTQSAKTQKHKNTNH